MQSRSESILVRLFSDHGMHFCGEFDCGKVGKADSEKDLELITCRAFDYWTRKAVYSVIAANNVS